MENEYVSSEVSEKIKRRLKEFGITAEEMLSELGMGKRTLQNYKASMPKADNLAKIADYLNCSVDYLLGRTDNPTVSGNNISNFDTTINGTQANIIQGAETDLDEIKVALSKLTSSNRHRAIADMLDLLEKYIEK